MEVLTLDQVRLISGPDSDLFCRDSILGQMLMTCGKLSNKAPMVKSRLNGPRYSSTL